jgi:hypothetical protein
MVLPLPFSSLGLVAVFISRSENFNPRKARLSPSQAWVWLLFWAKGKAGRTHHPAHMLLGV